MTQKAYMAGGCFWGMEDLVRKLPGVITTKVGYMGGMLEQPTYAEVKTGTTGHAETLMIEFDETKTSFWALLEFFFQIHDPTTINRQGNDIGSQYRSVIFTVGDAQRTTAKEVIAAVEASGLWPGRVVTELLDAASFTFWDAEDFHQDYLEKHPGGYTCHFPRANWKLPRLAS